ncbi:cytochrome P450 CYP72A219-like isoform X3 [Cucurbita moschata]|uniref:Cytochrome P450 CYP72A219-like isoform X3 n=1 Tax=Cucurbita moschata TaxID=3662 RepID=A0A6J1FEF7_CUCMO|nr:cytochrome P450 CYP72A219-like isoform X3 [Cucurbita moschata]
MACVTATVSIWIVVVGLVVLGGKILNSIWFRPKKLEKLLRQQGLAGNSYRILYGDLKDRAAMREQAISKPMNFSNDIAPRVTPSIHHTIQKYGKNSFMWLGPIPRVHIMDPEQLKTVFALFNDIQKPSMNPLVKLFAGGLVNHEGAKWAKHRKIINPAFHLEKLKGMVPAFYHSCYDMVSKWESMVSEEGSCDLDVMPYLQQMAADVISRTAFGSSYEKGKKIFQLQTELADLVIQTIMRIYIPGWRFLPTKSNKKMKELSKEISSLILGIINEREKSMKAGEAMNSDLLGILMESNLNEIGQHGNNKDIGMSIEDVIDECKIFYIAGQETTATLLIWTMILLSSYSEWQDRARAEVFEIFGNKNPDYDGLNRLKVVTMIFNEVLRLYAPVGLLGRHVKKETKLGNLTVPAGVFLGLPVLLIHRDPELWGEDADEFKPERFSEGVSKATKNPAAFIPFGWGPRICIGLNFAMIEAKMALSIILQRFSFELSPSYTHAPTGSITIQPQHGAHIILHKL